MGVLEDDAAVVAAAADDDDEGDDDDDADDHGDVVAVKARTLLAMSVLRCTGALGSLFWAGHARLHSHRSCRLEQGCGLLVSRFCHTWLANMGMSLCPRHQLRHSR